jgi:pimeloyl-ACP methyl ester carboxylesterase
LTDLQERDVQAGGLRLHLAEWGEGPPLLLIHGFLVCHQEWADMLPALSRHFRCIAVDLPGFGGSDKPGTDRFGYTREAFASVLHDLLDTLEISRAHVCGHSMGGAVALTLAADHPDRIERLTVMDAVCYPFEPPFKGKLPLLPGIGPIIFKKLYGRSMFRDYMIHDVFRGRRDRVNFARVDAYYDAFDAPGARDAAYATLPNTMDVSSLVSRIAHVQAPTLVLWGDEDPLFPVTFGRRLAQDLPDGRLRIVVDSGHAPNEEHGARSAELVIAHHLATGVAGLD